jgi:hypothetical protein
MSRRACILAALVVPMAAYVAHAAQLPMAPPSLPVPKLSKTPVPATAPDGSLHVTVNVALNFTKLNPLATTAGLSCSALVDDLSDVQARLMRTPLPSNLPAGVPASWATFTTAFQDIEHSDWVQVTLAGGTYQGTVAVNFLFSPAELSGKSAPYFIGHCWLLLGSGDLGLASSPPFAVLDASGIIQVPTSANEALVMSGQTDMDIGPAAIQFQPL